MVLDSVRMPRDLRSLNDGAIVELADELRAVVVDAVTTHGGHLGSNLGVVELSIALHRVFESPRDVILWDTGHQAYVHKLLTGRRAGFDALRQPGGLSGYPSRSESEHDWVENSHASTILSYAHGLSAAFAAQGASDRRVVAVIGDGAMTGGMAFEGLNNLGHAGSRVLIVLNDNGRSYAPTVSRLSESLIRLRIHPETARQQDRLRKLIRQIPVGADMVERGLDATKAAIRQMWEPRAFFEDLGVRYAGPFDGHDVTELEQALRLAAEHDGPVVLHVLTDKGRGYGPAEADDVKKLHDTSAMKPGSYTAAFAEAIVKEGEAHPDLVAITAAMPDSTGLLGFIDRFPERCIDVGIAEQHAVTMAAGLAMGGMRPVIALYSTFLTRAIDQTMYDVGLHRLPVVFCLDRAGITGDDGPSHHGVLDMVLLTKVPGITVFAPSSYQELQVMLHDALEIEDGPVAIRWPKTPAPSVPEDEVGAGLAARRVRTAGTGAGARRVALLGVGKMLAAAREAADRLAGDGVEVSVWDVRVVTPLDPVMIADAAGHDLVVTVEDGFRDGGAGAGIAAAVAATATPDRAAPPVAVLGVPTTFLAHGRADEILATLGLDGDGVAASARAALGI